MDWDFADLENEGIHRFHWYPATFVSAIPGTIIPLLTDTTSTVLDPFCGSCTTGVEAIRLGRRFVGVDVNPIAALISRAKLLVPSVQRVVKSMGLDMRGRLFDRAVGVGIRHPMEDELLGWYHERTYRELCDLLDRVRSLRSNALRTVGQALFSSILKTVSSQSRHWGWVCDNVKPRMEEFEYKNAYEAFRSAAWRLEEGVERLLRDMSHRGIDTRRQSIRRGWEITCGDTLDALAAVEPGSVDLVLTSPPYFGVADYVKSQRLSFLWFHGDMLPVEKFGTEDFEALRRTETGSRSYRHSKSSRSDYLRYMAAFFVVVRRLLRNGNYLCLVVGQSSAREDVRERLHGCAAAAGFELEFSTARTIRITKRRLMAKVGGEEILVYVAA